MLEPSQSLYWSPTGTDGIPSTPGPPSGIQPPASPVIPLSSTLAQPPADGPTVVWQPQPGPQTALIACPVFEVFFGGARGGGKTEGSIGDWLEHSQQYGEAAIGLFVRRKFTQLAEVIARTKQVFSKLGAKYNEQQKTWTMANGARLKFAYLERDSDADEYQGHSYTRIYVEEMPNFPSPGPIFKLKATLRSATGVPCCFRATGNPGGPGHKWVKHRYIDPNPAGYSVIREEEEVEIDGVKRLVSLDRVFIPSKITDNVMLMRNDPTYILRLRQSGSEALVRAWLEGDWNIVDGAFFDEFDYSTHVLVDDWTLKIPVNATRFRAFDWGSARPFSVGWYALSDGSWGLPKGAIFKYREWYGASAPNVGLKMPAGLVAKGIKERERGERIQAGWADPSIFIQDGGPSIAELMAVEGVQWARADNRRQPGWQALRQRLRGENGRPMIYFAESCTATIETIPTLQHDEKDQEDVDTDGEDHAGDETRYACMARPWIPGGAAIPVDSLPANPVLGTIRSMIDRARAKRLAGQRAEG